jgi:hypothetical protein
MVERGGSSMSLRVVPLLLLCLTVSGYSSAAGADDKADYDRRSAARYSALFQSLDRNGDSGVTRAEAQGDLNLGPVFDDMDINRDGVVSNGELQHYLEQRHGGHAHR